MMPLTLLRDACFGSARANVTGSTGVGYTVLDVAGNVVSPRTTTGVYQLVSGSGIYAANITFPDTFNGQVLWDCPSFTGSMGNVLAQAFAAEQQNVQENDPKVADTWSMVNSITGSIAGLVDVAFGRWKIDTAANQMLFYREDGVTLVATFDLLDDTGTPTFDSVFERRLNGVVTP